MALATKTLIAVAGIGLALTALSSLRLTPVKPLSISLLGSAAAELSGDRNAVGFLSAQQVCDPSLASVNQLSANGKFIAAYQESEFLPDMKRVKTFELLKLQSEFRGLAITGATPLSWSRSNDTFIARKSDGSVVSVDAESAQVTTLDSAVKDQINRLSRTRGYLGSESGVVIFGQSDRDQDIVLVDLENAGSTFKIPSEIARARSASISCPKEGGAELICRMTLEMQEATEETPLARRKTIVQVTRFSVSTGKVLDQKVKTSPELIGAQFVGELSNQAEVWLGYAGSSRNLFLKSINNSLQEVDRGTGDLRNAYLTPNENLLLENFSNEVVEYKPYSSISPAITSKSPWLQKSQKLIAGNADNNQFVFTSEPSANDNSPVALDGGGSRRISLGCTPSRYAGKWNSLGNAGYYEFLPNGAAPIGLLVFIHGGPFQRASAQPNPLVSAWLDKGYKVWALDTPGTPGFGLDHFLPSPAYIRQFADQLERRINSETRPSNVAQVDKFKTVLLGHSFGGFALLQLTKVMPKVSPSALVLVNSSCRDFFALRSPTGQSVLYAHAKAVGEAYQLLHEGRADAGSLCRASMANPVFVFTSENDTVLRKSHSERIARASNVELSNLRNEGHSVQQAGARFIVDSVVEDISLK